MASKIYYSIEVARLTVGYDLLRNKTQVRQWLLATTGPDEVTPAGIEEEARKQFEAALVSSAEQAALEAFLAALAVPGEFAVKLSVAWQVFWERFPVLVELRIKAMQDSVVKHYVEQFDIGLLEVSLEEDGLVLEAMAGTASAAMYAQLYDVASRQLSGDVGHVVCEYFELMNNYHEMFTVDIKIKAPKEVTDILAWGGEADKWLKEGIKDAPQRIVELTVAMGNAPEYVGKKVDAVVLKIGNEISKDLATQLQNAGIRVDFDPAVVATLVAGPARLFTFATDINAQYKEFTEQLAPKLQAEAEKLFRLEGEKLWKQAEEELAKLKTFQELLEAAIKQNAEAVVRELTSQYNVVKNEFERAKAKLDALAADLQANNLEHVAAGVVTVSADLANRFVTLNSFVLDAPRRVAENVAAQIQMDAQAALDAINQARDWAANKLKSFFGW